MKKICAMVLVLVLLLGASEAFAAASSNSLLLSMSVNESYTWIVPDAKIDCLVGVWGLWGAVAGTNMSLASGNALQISCYSQYGSKWKDKLTREKFCMVHNSYTTTGTYLLEYKLATDRTDEKDLVKNEMYRASWITKSSRKTTTNYADTYVIGKWTENFSQSIYYLIDPPATVTLGTYRDYVTFFANVVKNN